MKLSELQKKILLYIDCSKEKQASIYQMIKALEQTDILKGNKSMVKEADGFKEVWAFKKEEDKNFYKKRYPSYFRSLNFLISKGLIKKEYKLKGTKKYGQVGYYLTEPGKEELSKFLSKLSKEYKKIFYLLNLAGICLYENQKRFYWLFEVENIYYEGRNDFPIIDEKEKLAGQFITLYEAIKAIEKIEANKKNWECIFCNYPENRDEEVDNLPLTDELFKKKTCPNPRCRSKELENSDKQALYFWAKYPQIFRKLYIRSGFLNPEEVIYICEYGGNSSLFSTDYLYTKDIDEYVRKREVGTPIPLDLNFYEENIL